MTRSILFLTLLSLTSGAAAGQLLPAGGQDLVPQRLSATQPKAVRALPSEELHYAWALEADASLSTTAPHTAESREFWADHDAADWQSGIRIHTTQPGALVRISPIGGQRSALQPSELIVERDGRRYGNASALIPRIGRAMRLSQRSVRDWSVRLKSVVWLSISVICEATVALPAFST